MPFVNDARGEVGLLGQAPRSRKTLIHKAAEAGEENGGPMTSKSFRPNFRPRAVSSITSPTSVVNPVPCNLSPRSLSE